MQDNDSRNHNVAGHSDKLALLTALVHVEREGHSHKVGFARQGQLHMVSFPSYIPPPFRLQNSLCART